MAVTHFDFELPGITCTSCTDSIDNLLRDFKKFPITGYDLDFLDKTASIQIDEKCTLPPEVIKKELEDLLDPWSPRCLNENHWLKGAAGMLTGATWMILMALGIHLHPWPWFQPALIAAGSALTLYLGQGFFREAYSKGKQGNVSMATLVTLSSFAAVIATGLSFVFPLMPMLDAALMILGFRHLGKGIDSLFRQKLRSGLRYTDRLKREGFRRESSEDLCALDKIQRDDVLILQKGDLIPLDGTLENEQAEIIRTLINGNRTPLTLTQGMPLLQGMIAASDGLRLRVNALEKESYLARLDARNKEAKATKAPIQEMGEKLLKPLLKGLAFTSGLALGIGAWFLSPQIGVSAALYLLVCICPCILGLIVPLAMRIGLRKAAAQGVVFNQAKGLQAAAEVNTVVFDLNGTLTLNQPRVIAKESTIPEDYWPIIHAMELQVKDHPIAEGILKFLGRPKEVIQISDPDKNFNNTIKGLLVAEINGNKYRIGNRTFMEPPAESLAPDSADPRHVIYFSKNGKIEGYFILEDPLREGWEETIQGLQKMEKRIILMTGGPKDTALAFARKLKIPDEDVQADIGADHPKEERIKALQKAGCKVAMFGDSGNDANALLKADIGVVMNSCATDPMSIENAGASFSKDSLTPALSLFAVANETYSLVKWNLGISFTYNVLSLACVTLGFVGAALSFIPPSIFTPAYGAAGMFFQSMSVFLYTLYVQKKPLVLPTFTPSTPSSVVKMETPTSCWSRLMTFDWGKKVEVGEKPMKPIAAGSSQAPTPFRS
jgi:Cu2+-exporting ATPase